MSGLVCLIHYHEIGLKGNNRANFEHMLVDNLKAALGELPFSTIKRISGHILIRMASSASRDDAERVFESARQVPGVARVSLARVCEVNPEAYCQAACEELANSGDFYTFKVKAHRANTVIEMNSLELARDIGSYLCERFPDKKVQMKDPDRCVHVSINRGSAYVYVQTAQGIGGLPVGSAGKVISLLSSGIDSPVASWRMLRRGAVVVALHFSGRPQTADTSEWLVQDLIERLACAQGIGRLYVVPFGDIQRRIAQAVPDDLRIIMYRRMMVAFACRLARLEGAKALVTGESLGQVASQTLENILAVDEMSSLPVFRPLIGNDKREIIAEAQALGTFEISSCKAEDCCTLFMPRSPETHVKLEEAHRVWEGLDTETMLDEMMEALEYRSFPCRAYVAPDALREMHPALAPATFFRLLQ